MDAYEGAAVYAGLKVDGEAVVLAGGGGLGGSEDGCCLRPGGGGRDMMNGEFEYRDDRRYDAPQAIISSRNVPSRPD